jgi:pimeloyl-ACP methyl ester carboxylesterase
VKVVFLHGIGDGNPDREWLHALNTALEKASHTPIDDNQVIAPRYAALLKIKGISAEMPDVTYKPKDDTRSRREFARRQAAVYRLLQHEPGVATFGFNNVPPPWMAVAHAFGASHISIKDLEHVRGYVDSEGRRGAILLQIRDQLPTSGDIVLIGHSLGSVIAIDLLDRLPRKLRVRRFITIGSPANSHALHRGSERLLKKFPYSRVDDWTNFFSKRDPVTMGRGLGSIFPVAQDFAIDISGINVHPAERYLGHPGVAKLVADILYPPKQTVPASSAATVRLTDEQFLTLLKLRFAWAIAKKIKDPDHAQRYADKLNIIQDDFAAQLQKMADAGSPLPVEWHSVIAGQLPSLPNRLERSRPKVGVKAPAGSRLRRQHTGL